MACGLMMVMMMMRNYCMQCWEHWPLEESCACYKLWRWWLWYCDDDAADNEIIVSGFHNKNDNYLRIREWKWILSQGMIMKMIIISDPKNENDNYLRAREQRTLEEVSAYYKLRLYHYTHKSRFFDQDSYDYEDHDDHYTHKSRLFSSGYWGWFEDQNDQANNDDHFNACENIDGIYDLAYLLERELGRMKMSTSRPTR